MSVKSRAAAPYVLARDLAKWDAMVAADPHGGFMQSADWGRFKQSFGWAPRRIACHHEVSQLGLAQALFRCIPFSPFTIGYLPRGPLVDFANDDAVASMLLAIDDVARRARAVSITIELPVSRDAALSGRLQRLGLTPVAGIQHGSTRVIDLTPSLEDIQGSWESKWRYNTRLASKRGVAVRLAETDQDFAAWYAMFRATSVRDHFTVRGEEYYRRFWSMGRAAGATVLLLAEHDRILLAGIMVHHFGHEATYLYGASSNEGRNMMPNHLLQWEAMQWGKRRGALRYDMFGIANTDDPNEPLAGVSRFKAGFGGVAVRYGGAFERVYHRLPHLAVRRARAGNLG